MKKFFATGLILLSLLVITTGTVFAGSALSLIEVRNDGGGVTFVFRVTGEFSRNELKGFVQVQGGDSYPLSCVQQDETTVVCHASGKAGGQNVVVEFGGADFWTFVPERRAEVVSSWCYALYDLTEEAEDGWVQFAEHCMDREAVEGDTFVTYNPYKDEEDWTYYYLYNAPSGYRINNPGNGFYPTHDFFPKRSH